MPSPARALPQLSAGGLARPERVGGAQYPHVTSSFSDLGHLGVRPTCGRRVKAAAGLC